jgi:hypothetical protein
MGGAYSVALGINSPGQVTGWFSTPGPASQTRAFLYLPQPAYGLPAGGHDLSAGPGTSIGNDINDLGQIVGRGPGFTPMIWLPEPAYGLGAGMTHFPVETMFDQETLDAHGFLFTHSAQFTAIGGGIAVGYANFGFQDVFEVLLTARAIAWIDGELVHPPSGGPAGGRRPAGSRGAGKDRQLPPWPAARRRRVGAVPGFGRRSLGDGQGIPGAQADG